MPDSVFDGIRAPELIVEIGWAYSASGSGISDGFILDVSQLDIVPFASEKIWYATEDFISINVSRGEDRLTDDTTPGTASVVLDNHEGAYDPENPNGPLFVGSQIQPMRQIRLRAVWNDIVYPIFQGQIDDYEYNLGEEPTCTLVCSDPLTRFAGQNVAEIVPSFAGDSTGARINRLLDIVGWDAALRNIAAGNYFMSNTDYGDNLLGLLNDARLVDQGTLFLHHDGRITFYDGRAQYERSESITPQVTLSDTIGEATDGLLFTAIDVEFGGSQVVNSWSVTRVDFADPPTAVAQVEDDTASIAAYTRKSDQMTDVGLQTDLQASYLAQARLLETRFPQFRVRQIVVDMLGQAAAGLWDEVLSLDRLDRLRVVRNYTDLYTFDRELLVCGVEHDVSDGKWNITFKTSDPSVSDGFILDQSQFGSTDVLVY